MIQMVGRCIAAEVKREKWRVTSGKLRPADEVKSQIKGKSQSPGKFQSPKFQQQIGCFGVWTLGLSLGFGAWDLGFP